MKMDAISRCLFLKRVGASALAYSTGAGAPDMVAKQRQTDSNKAFSATRNRQAAIRAQRYASCAIKTLSRDMRILRCAFCLLVFLGTISPVSQAQLATTPPMGWNSWDSYGLTITGSQFKQNVNWLHAHLQSYGWKYVVIDEGWYLAHPENAGVKGADQGYTMDAYGRYTPAIDRFPSAANERGFQPLAAYVHSLGLKFGIHIIRGIPRQAVERNLLIAGSNYYAADAADTSDVCYWCSGGSATQPSRKYYWNSDNYGVRNNAAGQAYYDSLVRLYASWGVDFIKVDCIASPYRAEQIRMIHLALKKTRRRIVLSLSPGPTSISEAYEVRKYAQIWRISNDLIDSWSPKGLSPGLKGQFSTLAEWAPYVEIGHWPDADMLPLGSLYPPSKPRQTMFTPDEQRTMITLWSIARSPLILGANLTKMDSATEALLTNREVIAVDQHSTDNKAVIHTPESWVWTARATSAKGEYVALFNVSDRPLTMEYTWHDIGLAAGKHRAHDLWLHNNSDGMSGLKVTLRPHASMIYRVE